MTTGPNRTAAISARKSHKATIFGNIVPVVGVGMGDAVYVGMKTKHFYIEVDRFVGKMVCRMSYDANNPWYEAPTESELRRDLNDFLWRGEHMTRVLPRKPRGMQFTIDRRNHNVAWGRF